MNKKVDEFLNNTMKWKQEMKELRTIALDCILDEELKWKQPVYTYKKKNILIISAFKDYCILGFFKGALLKDEHKILSKPGENTQAGRQARFTNLKDIQENKALLKAYIIEAIEVEKAGLGISYKKTPEFPVPEELQNKLNNDKGFNTAFNSLTPGRQRAYLLNFSQAKQSATRIARIEKYTERILKGQGLNDCVCGLSKRKPNCDGSHKFIDN